MAKYALVASVTLHGREVEARVVPAGRTARVGVIPVPEQPEPGMPPAAPYLAEVHWTGPSTAAVIDSVGQQHLVELDRPLRIDREGLAVRLEVMRRYALLRRVGFTAGASFGWLMIVMTASLVAAQLDELWPILMKLALALGLVTAGAPVPQGPGAMTAEYLARLLREDYAGEEDGVIENKVERPDAERKTENDEQFYLPAGQPGAGGAMGGAADTAPTPIRTPPGESVTPKPKRAPKKPLLPKTETAEAIAETSPETDDNAKVDGEVAAPVPDKPQVADAHDAPAEEKKGWGVPDWYDETDKKMDDLEIKVMLQAAQHRLRLVPDDPTALSILSYYQYLAGDFENAESTYNKYIALYPEDPAGYNNKALVYKRQGAYDKEEMLYRTAIQLDPLDTTARNNLAVNLAHQGRYEEALDLMKQLESTDPNDPYADLHRAKIYAAKGDDTQALAYLEKALQGMAELDTLHHIEFRQDIRLDPAFDKLRQDERFRAVLWKYYGKDTPLQE